MISGAGGLLMVALRFVLFTATTGALGAWVFARFVLRRGAAEALERRRAALAGTSGTVAVSCATVIMLLAVPRLVTQAQALNEPGDPLGPALQAVLLTHWGWALAAQALAALVAVVALAAGARRGTWSHAAETSVAVLAIAPAFMGHAVADADHRWLSVVVDVLHVATAGGWIGALALLTLVAWRERRNTEAPALLAALVGAFHPIAMVAAGTVFVTGLGTAWLRMGAPVGIADPTYSGLFVAKLLLVGVTAAFGAGHARQAKKRPVQVEPAAIGRTLLGETLLAVLVLAVTAILTGTSPIG